MKRICIIGLGYVGLITGACLAEMGNNVIGLDSDRQRCEMLEGGIMPIFEPGLEEMVQRNRQAGRLSFATRYRDAVPGSDIVFIAVGTPSGAAGQADLQYVEAAARAIAEAMTAPLTVVNKSTVPIGTGDLVADIIRQYARDETPFAVVSNPEFLREGSGIYDYMQPDRIVLGATDRKAAQEVADLYRDLNCPILITDLHTAEMIKYASNAFLATKISFINEMANICEQLGADVRLVAEGLGRDKRIGPAFLQAGLGWGGSCFPKDVQALISMAANHGAHPQLLRSVVEINSDQRRQVVVKLHQVLGNLRGRTVGILGLAFKPNTDDMREAPAKDIIALLQSEGAIIRAYDPAALANARRELANVTFCENSYLAAEGCDALSEATEWEEFRLLDMARVRIAMRHPVLVDGRNLYDPGEMAALGFVYRGIGRSGQVPVGAPAASWPTAVSANWYSPPAGQA
ncbi:MAG: UDP-glucose dehydrogenase family protein [Chloroflexota bacterium]